MRIGNSLGPEVLLDLVPGVGNFMEGWLKMRTLDQPIFYMAATDDDVNVEWLRTVKTRQVADLFIEGQLKIPGFSNKLEADPGDEQPPPRPRLNVLVFKGSEADKTLTLAMPEGISKQWAGHHVHGQEFEAFLENFYKQYQVIDDCKTPTPKKRSKTKSLTVAVIELLPSAV